MFIESITYGQKRTCIQLFCCLRSLLFLSLIQGCVSAVEEPGQTRPITVTPTGFKPDTQLTICAGMRVSNAPGNINRRISPFNPVVSVNNVSLLVVPVRGACLSSGFGPRGSGRHKGVDYHQRPGGPVFSAGSGRVIEMVFRRDYGNMLLIDHGQGVYTRYAHLRTIATGISTGSTVEMGSRIGIMGSTGRTSAVHLHYEILTGNYDNPKRSFGLTPRNPFY